jgi:hypothetical protein
MCGWSIEATDEPGVWTVRSREGLHGTDGKLLEFTKMADRKNAESEGPFSRLNRLKRHDGVGGADIWEVALNAHHRLAERYPDENAALLRSMQLLISAAPTARDAAAITKESFTEYMLPNAENPSLYLVEVAEHLSYRYTVSRLLLATKNNVSASTFTTEGMVSRSSKGLFSDTAMGLSAYLSCMSACLSPAIWAYPIGRPGGVVLILFGDAVSGQDFLTRDKIQLLSPGRQTPDVNPPHPANPRVYVRAAQWWVAQLNTLFSIITEPANYVADGLFDPAESTERLLSVEQTFRDCQSILTLTRDDHARTTLTFTLLKRLEGLIPGYKWKRVVGRSSLESLVQQLKLDIPSEIHDVFLWRATRGVRAVAALEDGFFTSPGDDGPILLPDKNGVLIKTERRNAVTEWLQLIRNSLHGFGKPSPRDRALLASHDGNIPSDFADVAWLHVLDIVAHPEKLAKFAKLNKMADPKRQTAEHQPDEHPCTSEIGSAPSSEQDIRST